MTTKRIALVALVVLGLLVPATARTGGEATAADTVGEKTLVDNDRVLVMEFVFPPGFKGDEHEVPADEFAYVLDGEFAVVTRGKGKTVVRKGQVEYAPKGTVHHSLNETKRPARLLVVLLKER